MELKRFLINKLILFFMLSTLICAAIFIIGSVFDGEARFGYDAFLSPIIYAAFCMLPTFLTWSKREIKPRQMLFRKVLILIIIEAEVLFMAFRSPKIDTSRIQVVLTLAGSVLVIYVLTNFFLWLKDSAEAKKLNAELLYFQQQHEE